MKKLSSFITEKSGAQEEAERIGLKYVGFGRYVDPRTGSVVAKTDVNGNLEMLGNKESQPEEDPAPRETMAVGGARASQEPPAGSPGPGEAIGAPPEPLEINWEPGPDGNTCVGDQPPGEVPPDTFVGKTNNANWVAGPDGSTNGADRIAVKEAVYGGEEGKRKQEYEKRLKQMLPKRAFDQLGREIDPRSGKLKEEKKEKWPTASDKDAPHKKLVKRPNKKYSDSPHGDFYAPSIKEEEEKQGDLGLSGAGYQEKPVTNRAKERMKKIMGKKPASGRTDREAQDALNQMRANPDQQTVLGKQLASMMKIANREAAPDPFATNIKPPNQSDKERNERNKEHDMWKKAAKLPAIKKDADAVTEMNKAIQPLLKDPNFDMEVDYDEESIGEGAFGQVFKKGDNVIKMGQIGPDELKALYAMRDNPSFPTLINARFDTPFQQYSAEYNNPMNADNERRGPQGYWDPDEASDFDKRFPGAEGTYAMTAAKGVPLYDAFGGYSLDGPPPDEEMEDKIMRNFWRARGQLHKAGFSHNDMHGGNVFVDPDTGEVSIIDLGLAKDDPRSALMEALGGMDYENQEDYQLAHQVAGGQLPERLRETFDKNRGDAEQMILDSMPVEASEYDDYDEEQDYSPQYERSTTALQDMLRGGIRMKREDLDQLGEDIPFLKDNNNIMKLIKTLYSEVGQSELADRMSDAYDRRKADTDVIRRANELRSRRGEPKIDLKNRNVIPPENLDPDD